MSAIRLLVADDHEMVRVGLRVMLSDTDIRVVAEASTGEDAVRQALEKDVDVALLDVRMPKGDGLHALVRIKLGKPELPVLLISAYDNPTYVARSVALGASGFVMKDSSRKQMIRVIREAAAGRSAWDAEELRRVSGALAIEQACKGLEVPLTQRESEVLRQLAYGLTNKEIAQALHISYETVKEHVQHVLHKIGVSDRTQAAVWVVRNNLV
ncbi:MAG TPA: response regulator transcription factor [Planctomycetaceae bacterium]|nr:response regulator transcription factor [Planctomycetaceae bacterium]